MSFLNSKLIKNHLLFDIFDIDEFILKEAKKFHQYSDIWDLGNVRRYSFELLRVENNSFVEEEISTEEYLERKESDNDFMCFTRLNYEEFSNEFPITEMEEAYGDEWLYDYHCNKVFIPAINNWIDNSHSDASTEIKLQDLIDIIKRSLFALGNIKYGWSKDIPLNEIQKSVIKIFIKFDEVVLDKVNSRYSKRFPDVFSKSNNIKSYSDKLGFKINQGYGENYKEALNLLKQEGFVKNNTSPQIFRNAFSSSKSRKIETQIIWTGTLNELNYFIKTLNAKGIIESDGSKYQKHWEQTKAVFKHVRKNQSLENIRGNNKEPKKKKTIDLITSIF